MIRPENVTCECIAGVPVQGTRYYGLAIVCVNRFILVFILSSTEKYICSDYPQIFVERLFKELYKSVLYDIFKSLYHTNFSSWPLFQQIEFNCFYILLSKYLSSD